MGGIVRFPGNGPDRETPVENGSRRIVVSTCIEVDQDLDRFFRQERNHDSIQDEALCSTGPNAFFHVLRLLRHKPMEIVVFCTTLPGEEEGRVPWGDVYGLTDPPDTYRYLFTLYTRVYVQDCRHRRGETIRPSAEDVILSVPTLTGAEVRRGVVKWVNRYYPPLKGLPIRLEDQRVVDEMIAAAFDEP